jgi:hypothetical protein
MVLIFSVLGHDTSFHETVIACGALGMKNALVIGNVGKYLLELAQHMITEKFISELRTLIEKALDTDISEELRNLLEGFRDRMEDLEAFTRMSELIKNKDYAGALGVIWELVGK